MVAGPGRECEVPFKRPVGNRFADYARPVCRRRRAHHDGDAAQPDRLALSNLATPLAPIFNSKLARQHATPEDPWAQEWLKTNTAGSGAYTIEIFKPGEQVVLRRNEDWKGGRDGQLPFFKRSSNRPCRSLRPVPI